MQAPPHASTQRPQRPICNRCQRPQTSCICQWITPTVSNCAVLILQHPLEVHEAKNSARLLHLSLPGSRLVVGEAFDDPALAALLPQPAYPVLLYPPTAYCSACRASLWQNCQRRVTPSARRTSRGSSLR